MRITKEQFLEKYKAHQEWCNNANKGARLVWDFEIDFKFEFEFTLNLGSADLSSANLSSANLSSANLRYANLSSANLRSANLSYADLGSADLSSADLGSADLSSANLSSANLRYANLRYADLGSADLDFSSGISFHCNSKGFKADLRLAAQMAMHFCWVDFGDCQEALEAQSFLVDLANKMHRIETGELPRVGQLKEG